MIRNYSTRDQIILDKNFKYSLLLKKNLEGFMRGATFIDFEPKLVGEVIPKEPSYGILINYPACFHSTMEIIRSILELSKLDDVPGIEIGFTDSKNLEQNTLGGRTIILLTNTNLLGKTTLRLPVYEA